MTFARLHRSLAAGAALLIMGCIPRWGVHPSDGARADWPAALAAASADATAHRYAEADRALADFAARYPQSLEERETLYWRALFRLDPANREASPAAAADWLGSYVRTDAAISHRLEAETLRRLLAARADSTAAHNESNSAAASAAAAGASDLKSRDDEIRKLRDELSKANEELDRIKRRLTAPTKP